ncbi:unnamed protein product [Vitrella brassicaformis CCMP3155]|uniref:Uncharacterized protein n=1 Tax=Vitrella brassicaformis (strain CCMP3155) TaxID=1169540 RepID=A0A0G4EBY0_VITBC|nr:unnamed protein product [Vitrella brassicaformis CCMP3155]|eukprot:CEL93492.1 unnamed protein product [Vitrella brassicaformis CCMP3155]
MEPFFGPFTTQNHYLTPDLYSRIYHKVERTFANTGTLRSIERLGVKTFNLPTPPFTADRSRRAEHYFRKLRAMQKTIERLLLKLVCVEPGVTLGTTGRGSQQLENETQAINLISEFVSAVDNLERHPSCELKQYMRQYYAMKKAASDFLVDLQVLQRAKNEHLIRTKAPPTIYTTTYADPLLPVPPEDAPSRMSPLYSSDGGHPWMGYNRPMTADVTTRLRETGQLEGMMMTSSRPQTATTETKGASDVAKATNGRPSTAQQLNKSAVRKKTKVATRPKSAAPGGSARLHLPTPQVFDENSRSFLDTRTSVYQGGSVRVPWEAYRRRNKWSTCPPSLNRTGYWYYAHHA